MQNKKPKVIIILGPTSIGKTALGIKLAKHFEGEIISADSRQIYRGLDLSTGKVTPEETRGIPHHLIDILDLDKSLNAAQFRTLATNAISDVHTRGKLPIVVGGTGFYLSTLVDNLKLPEVPPNEDLRKKLEQDFLLARDRELKKIEQEGGNVDLKEFRKGYFYDRLKKIDSSAARRVDQGNVRRMIRLIEIATKLGKVPKTEKQESPFDFFQVGLTMGWEELRERIYFRTIDRIDSGMVKEVQRIHDRGVSWERLEELGFDQKYCAQFLQGKITETEMKEKIIYGNVHYAKRQMTWFKRDERIHWFKPGEYEKIIKEIQLFL